MLMQSLLQWLRQIASSRYLAMLEAEVERLRAENRALTNSLLGTAGFPPVDYPTTSSQPREIPRARKRSWHQIQAWRESEATRSTPVSVDERANGTVLHS
jgi:hypothetical protein